MNTMPNNRIVLEGLPSINGGINTAILTEKKAVYPYVDGKRASDNPTDWRIGVALQGSRFDSLSVRIEGAADPLPGITDEEIAEACRSKVIAVTFDQLKVSVYTIGGNLVKTGTAAAVSIVGK